MENKELVSNESIETETTPLLSEGKDDESSTKTTSLSHLASELSELSLEVSHKVTSTTIDASVAPQEPTVPESEQAPALSAQEPEATAEVSDVEPQDRREDDEPLDRSETESPPDSEENTRWFDRTMFMIIFEVLLLALPISMIYFGIYYWDSCEGGDKLPMLLIILAFLSSLTLLGRILINIANKLSFYDSDLFPPMSIYSGEVLVIILFIAEVVYIFKMDRTLCDENFFLYVFYMNNIAAMFVVIIALSNLKRCFRCCNILRE